MRKRPYTLRFHTNEYQYLGNHPEARTHTWAENAQGVTHDEEHWYISNDEKIVKYHITTDISSENVMKSTGMPLHLRALTYKKFKALTHYKGFLFVPIDPKFEPLIDSFRFPGGDPHQPSAIAMFRASDLSYVHHVLLDKALGLGTPGWVAFHPKEGRLYTSGKVVGYGKGLAVFNVSIPDDGSSFTLEFSHEVFPRLKMPMESMQGGAFSPEGQLYLINGYYDTDVSRGGISVFSMHDYHFRQKSEQSGKFRFQWDTSWDVAEEPEGLCFWDLDQDGRAPKISGQLHAIVLDNDAGPDDVYMKHYRMSAPLPFPIPEFYLCHSHLKDEAIDGATLAPDSVRGITHNHQARFVATIDGLHSMPILADNPAHLPIFQQPWPEELRGSEHWGDITHCDGFILVPFLKNKISAVASFNTQNLRLNEIAELPGNRQIAFAGINPLTREHLHTVDVQGNIRKYKFELSQGKFTLIPEGGEYSFDTPRVPAPLTNVTGGEISAVSGFCYVVHNGQITAFHSDGSFVDASGTKYNLGEETFAGPNNSKANLFLTTDCWHESFPLGTDFDNIPDVSAFVQTDSGDAVLRSWEISTLQLIGNKRTKEFHRKGCPFQRLMALKNYVHFVSVESARSSGYDGCYYCMHSYNKR